MEINSAFKRKQFEVFLKGSIFINKIENIPHEKYFIIMGVSKDKILTCSVLINSEIHPSIFAKQEILDLQVPIKKENYTFLKYDSFACCSFPLYFKVEKIFYDKEIGACRHVGDLNEEDLKTITDALISSGLLSQDEIDTFFS